MNEPLTVDEVAALRKALDALTRTSDGDILPGPWHGRESGDKGAFGWWLDNDAGDSSFPDPNDVALFLNVLPRLLECAENASARERLAYGRGFNGKAIDGSHIRGPNEY